MFAICACFESVIECTRIAHYDGKYHMYAGRWPQGSGFANWPNSVIVEGVSVTNIIGSYVPSTTTPFTGKEQNVTGINLNNGGDALIVSPGKIHTSTITAPRNGSSLWECLATSRPQPRRIPGF